MVLQSWGSQDRVKKKSWEQLKKELVATGTARLVAGLIAKALCSAVNVKISRNGGLDDPVSFLRRLGLEEAVVDRFAKMGVTAESIKANL